MMMLTYGDDCMKLSEKKCVPCEGGVPPLGADAIGELLSQLPDWTVIHDHHLEQTFTFDDFASALEFVNRAGQVCEDEFHHADFELGWGRVNIKIWTHKIDGLTESDFVLAAKISEVT